MAETSPGDAKATERLHRYWVHGEGAAKIGWGQGGDFDRCVLELGKYIRDPKGYCAKAHHEATGMWPAQHAAMEHGRAAMATDTKAKPYGDVTYADPKNGKYPVDTEAHAKAAWSYINMPKNASQYPMGGVTLSEVKDRIKAACKKFGIDVSDGDGSDGNSGRAESLASYVRSFPLEDISIRTTRDGRIVEAYLAVFNTPSKPIHDQDGDYTEELDPVVFNRAISDARPQGSRRNWRTGVFYNHAMTLYGTPSERFSVPVAATQGLETDGHGVRATDKYHRSQLCDEIVEGLESGAIPGYSFQGSFRRSQPLIPRGGFKKNYRTGDLPHVRRMESTLKEYGPTPFPAYADAAVLGIRSDSLIAAMMSDPDLAARMIGMFRDGAPPDGDSPPLSGAPQDGDSPAEDSHQLVRSGRSVKEEMQARRSAFLQRYRR
jgi:phage head maturation protease